MKKIILFLLIIALLSTVIIASESIIEKERPTKTKDLEIKTIEKENNTKLIKTYGKQFKDLKKFNNYEQYGDITIINVTMKQGKTESYARIITNTKKFNEVLNKNSNEYIILVICYYPCTTLGTCI